MSFLKKKTETLPAISEQDDEIVEVQAEISDFKEADEGALEEQILETNKEEVIEDILDEMITEYTVTKQHYLVDIRRETIDKKDFLKIAETEFLDANYGEYEEYHKELMKRFEEYLFGYHVLTPLVEDPDISDIAVVAYNNIQIKKKGVNSGSEIKFKSQKQYSSFVQYVAGKNQVDVSNINSIQIFTDRINCKDFILRFVIVMPLLTSSGAPYLCIRKIAKTFPEMDDLIKDKMMTEKQRDYFIDRFQTGSVLVCGPSASGKTTFLNALKEKIPHDKSCLIIQETEEMSIKNHPYMMLEHPVANKGEGRVKFSLFDIVAAGLLMNMSYFIIGEVKGAEALYLLNAAYTGHICATTVHAENAQNALDKLADYAKYGSDYKKSELMKMLTSFKTVVYIKDYKVKEVYEINGWDELKEVPLYRLVNFTE